MREVVLTTLERISEARVRAPVFIRRTPIVPLARDSMESGRAFRTLFYRGKLLAEPARAVASAGLLAGKVNTSLHTVAGLTGDNLTKDTAARHTALAQGT